MGEKGRGAGGEGRGEETTLLFIATIHFLKSAGDRGFEQERERDH